MANSSSEESSQEDDVIRTRIEDIAFELKQIVTRLDRSGPRPSSYVKRLEQHSLPLLLDAAQLLNAAITFQEDEAEFAKRVVKRQIDVIDEEDPVTLTVEVVEDPVSSGDEADEDESNEVVILSEDEKRGIHSEEDYDGDEESSEDEEFDSLVVADPILTRVARSLSVDDDQVLAPSRSGKSRNGSPGQRGKGSRGAGRRRLPGNKGRRGRPNRRRTATKSTLSRAVIPKKQLLRLCAEQMAAASTRSKQVSKGGSVGTRILGEEAFTGNSSISIRGNDADRSSTTATPVAKDLRSRFLQFF